MPCLREIFGAFYTYIPSLLILSVAYFRTFLEARVALRMTFAQVSRASENKRPASSK